jgi:Mg2+/Co2+ transporter CorB
MSDLVAVGGGVTIALLLCLSAFFSSSETAIFSLPRAWIEQQARTTDRRARVLKELHDDPHRLLVTLLVGNNIVNIAISSLTSSRA